MDLIQTIILSLIQGVTEFLPVSSSAHLILVPKLTNWNDQGLAFDIVLHLGTLSAIVFYFKIQIKQLLLDFFNSIHQQRSIGESKMAWGVILGTIPVGLVGLFFKDFIELHLRSIEVIAYSTLIFGILLGFADWFNAKKESHRTSINWFDILIIGSFQAIALIPGTSRSGITITAGLLLGLSRQLSAQFSFLLSIPVIILSAILTTKDIIESPEKINLWFLFLGFSISGLFAYLTITWFMKLIEKSGMLPFVIYRLILGLLLFTYA
ncbi:Undecaprenyl-diphosphatase [hydrothermal vent metagenome]|uniref:Undecaprenyl-diphosphatase n=1 Tax=hydrothermal vent metagenome TaxID=652676 RepID=A0A1W1CAD7_9ZZZZ